MTWNCISKIEYLETITIDEEFNKNKKSEIYDLTKHANLPAIQIDKDAQLTIVRQIFFEEEFKKEFEIKYETGTALELKIKFRDESQIISITEFWGEKEKESWNKYNFENNKLRHIKSCTLTSPYHILAHPICTDKKIIPFFDELKIKRPKLKKSLDACIKELLKN